MNPDAARHRLLEGVLHRLRRRSDASDFLLRGGLLLRHWFRPVVRPADDLDFVATFPFSVEDTGRRLLPVFEEPFADGVAFDADQIRVAGIWLDTGNPGVRFWVTGTADGTEIDFNVDVTFGPTPRPAPVFGPLPTAVGDVAVWMCRPAAVLGHKMQALWHRGVHGWRPKDLHDVLLLFTLVEMDAAAVRDAVVAYLADVGATIDNAREMFGPAAWWGMKLSSARWLDYVGTPRGRAAPRQLSQVVDVIAGHLGPILENLP